MAQSATLKCCSYRKFASVASVHLKSCKTRVMGEHVSAAASSEATAPSDVKDLLNFRDLGHSAPDVCRSGLTVPCCLISPALCWITLPLLH